MTDRFGVVITFMDGSTVTLQGVAKDAVDRSLGKMIETYANVTSFPLLVDGAIVFYPVSNIRSMEISPAPQTGLPPWMNKSLKRV